jgi:hypothetical protein
VPVANAEASEPRALSLVFRPGIFADTVPPVNDSAVKSDAVTFAMLTDAVV